VKARIWLPLLLALWLSGCERAPSADDTAYVGRVIRTIKEEI
jgi:Tfp pilus assembly protein PilP